MKVRIPANVTDEVDASRDTIGLLPIPVGPTEIERGTVPSHLP